MGGSFYFFQQITSKKITISPSYTTRNFYSPYFIPIFFFYNIIFKYHIPHTHPHIIHSRFPSQLFPSQPTNSIHSYTTHPTRSIQSYQYTHSIHPHKLYINTPTNHLPTTNHPPRKHKTYTQPNRCYYLSLLFYKHSYLPIPALLYYYTYLSPTHPYHHYSFNHYYSL